MAEIEFKGFAGVRLRADVYGSPEDPLVLMLPGGAQTRSSWDDAAEALVKAGRQVICVDLRGHGESEWPSDARYDFDSYVEDLRAILGQLRSRPVVVAASLSGWIATAALVDDGAQLATGLVLADAPPRLSTKLATAIGEALRGRAKASGDSLEWDPRFLDAFDIVETCERVSSSAPRLALPVLFVRGALSSTTSHDEAEQFVQQVPNAEFIEIEDAGHLVATERSEIFNAVLLDYLERTVPRIAPEYREGSDSCTLRDALGCFATGVTIVTATTADGQPIGLTANSFTSVSLDPPLLLVCIANSAGSLSVLEKASHFGVNVLHIGQQLTSNKFASRNEDRFSTTPWEKGDDGVPVLMNSLATFECAQHAVHEGGDHIILVGRVVKARFEPRRDPLLYFRGKYRRLHFS